MANRMLFRQRAVIPLDQPAVRLRHGLRRAGVQPIVCLLIAQLIGSRPLGALERGGQLHLQLVPLCEVLLPGFCPRCGPAGIETVGFAREAFQPVLPLHVVQQLPSTLPWRLRVAVLDAAALGTRSGLIPAAAAGATAPLDVARGGLSASRRPLAGLFAEIRELSIELRQLFAKLANS